MAMTSDRARGDAWRKWAPAALTALVALPIVVAVLRAVVRHWFPIGDSALLSLRARDVLTAHHPLLGSWTSASLTIGHDVNNPGPLYSDLVAPFAKIVPHGAGVALGVGAVNVASVVAISLVSRKIGGWRLQCVFLVVAAALVWTMGSWLLIDIWQPHALLLPFVLLVVVLLGIANRSWWCVPWMVGVASLIVQTHIAYAYVLVALLAAVLALAATGRGSAARGSLRRLPWRAGLTGRTARWSVGVFLVLWSQPLVEQFFGSGEGNLSRLARGASAGGVKVGAANALRLTATVFFQAPWTLRSGFSTVIPPSGLQPTTDGPALVIDGIHRTPIAAAIVLVMLATLVALAVAHRRRGDQLLATSCWLAAAGVVAGVACVTVLSVSSLGLGQHHVRWLWPMAIVVQSIAGWALAALVTPILARRSGRLKQAIGGRFTAGTIAASLVAASLVAVLTASALPDYAQPQGPTADRASMPALREVFGQLAVLRSSGPVVFDLSNLRIYEPYSTAVMMRLQELGIEFHVTDPSMLRQLGDRRAATGTERTTIFQLEGLAVTLYDGPACRVAVGSALPVEQGLAAQRAAQSLAGRIADGQLTVEPSALAPDDAARLAAAQSGDAGEALRLVDDGTLARWGAAGTVALDDDDRATLDLIGRWVASAYAVYALDAAVCPTQPEL